MGAIQPADLLRDAGDAVAHRLSARRSIRPAPAPAPGGLSRDVVEALGVVPIEADAERGRLSSPVAAPLPRLALAVLRALVTATVEPLLVGDDAARGAARGLRHGAGAGRARDPRASRCAKRPSASRWRSRAGRAQPRAAGALRTVGVGAPRGRRRARGDRPAVARRPGPGPRRERPSSSPRRARHGWRHLQRTERAADPAGAARSHRVRHRQRQHGRLQDRARPDRRGAPAGFRPGAADGDRRRRRARPDRLPRRIDRDHQPRPRRRARGQRLLRRSTRPRASRYTRNGQFSRRADGTLVDRRRRRVRRATAAAAITAGARARSSFEPDGTVRAGGVVAGKLKIVDFGDYVGAAPRGRRRASAPRPRSTPVDAPATSRVRGGALEQSNVQLPERMVQLTEVARAFEALQRGITDADERHRRPRHLGAGTPLGGSTRGIEETGS